MLRACVRSGIDVAAAAQRFHAPAAHGLRSATDASVAAWLRELRGATPIADAARRAGRSRFAVSRWLVGRSRPRLPDFLRLLDALTGRASDFVSELVPIDAVPTLKTRHTARVAAKRLAFEEPWTEAILRVLETDTYASLERHHPGFIARQLGIDEQSEARCLLRMTKAGIIARRRGRFVGMGPLTVDMQAPSDHVVRLKKHWNQVAANRLENAQEGDIFSYNVVSVSASDLDVIRDLLRATFREIRSIVAASEPVERVALVQLQLIAWGSDLKR